MQVAPNQTILEGVVRKITPEVSGFGRELVVDVEAARPAGGKQDFLNATRGDRVKVLLSAPDDVQVGQRYAMRTTVLGGPRGERTVVESIRRTRTAALPD